MSLRHRAVLVHRRTEYDDLLARHGTRQQAAFFLDGRGRSLTDVVARHDAQGAAMQATAAAVPVDWRRAEVERGDLAHFVFGPEDVVLVVGQDGLVANVAKYLDGQPVVGVNPDPGRNPGVLVPIAPTAVGRLLAAAPPERYVAAERTMVRAVTDDGQELRALNEVYVGHASHQSARYVLATPGGDEEAQSSSGILVGTGTGATGWLRSAWQERRSPLRLPDPAAPSLCWFVREAWPSPATGTSCTEGELAHGEALVIRSESDRLACFGDGMEADALALTWGQTLTVATDRRRLRLVVGA